MIDAVAALQETTESPVFVVGFPRSGTTLMRYLLNDHPQQAIAPETHFLVHFVPKYRNCSLSNPGDLHAFWTDFTSSEWFPRFGLEARDIYNCASADDASFRSLFRALLRVYAASTGKPRIGEKTPEHYEHLATLLSWFPNARVVFLLRDPRAVIASYLHIEQKWAEGANAYSLARRWQAHLSHVYRWRNDPRVRVIRYEDLVRNPHAELPEILNFVGLSDETSAILTRRPARRHATGSLAENAQLSDANVDLWRTRLSPRQISTVEGVLGTRMTSFGYALDRARLYSRYIAHIERAQRAARLLSHTRAGAL